MKSNFVRGVLLTGIAVVLSAAAAEKVTFKPVVAALLKIDQRQAKFWNVYKATKNQNLILVQLGSRYLVLDAEAREVTEVPPEQFQRKGRELRWQRKEPTAEAQRERKEGEQASSREKVLPSDEWNVREAGPVRIIRVRLASEGRVVEVQLPLWER